MGPKLISLILYRVLLWAEVMGALWSLLFGERVRVEGINYRIVRRIGEGGFSYVSLVRGGDGAEYALVRWSPHACVVSVDPIEVATSLTG